MQLCSSIIYSRTSCVGISLGSCLLEECLELRTCAFTSFQMHTLDCFYATIWVFLWNFFSIFMHFRILLGICCNILPWLSKSTSVSFNWYCCLFIIISPLSFCSLCIILRRAGHGEVARTPWHRQFRVAGWQLQLTIPSSISDPKSISTVSNRTNEFFPLLLVK